MKKFMFFLLSVCLLQGSDSLDQKSWTSKIMDKVCTSKVMDLYSSYIQSKIDNAKYSAFGFGNEPASEKYQQLALEAQRTIEVPQHKILPVIKINSQCIPALAGANAIYLNEENLDKRPYGSVRSSLFHEAVHIKYNDAAILDLSRCLGFLVGTAGTCRLLKMCNILKRRKSLSVLGGLVSAYNLPSKYKCFMEQRADTQGHLATNCASCIQEEIQYRSNMYQNLWNNLSNNGSVQIPYLNNVEAIENAECSSGYLTRTKLKEIADKVAFKACEYHFKM